MPESIPSDAIGTLRECLANLKNTPTYRQIVEPRDGVLARFQPVFSLDHIPQLTEDEFRSFLLFENNHHWTGLQRQGSRIFSDMALLRDTLAQLLDEAQPIHDRLNMVNKRMIGIGKAIATGILLIAYPDRYGVWNRTSRGGMVALDIWPTFEWGESFGQKYVKINQVLLQLRDALQTDLWTLDAIWWALANEEFLTQTPVPDIRPGVADGPIAPSNQRFGLERHLHEFLRDNWDHLDIGQQWAIYAEDGDDEAGSGYEYVCPVGRIDILAKHRTDAKWLVVELKRGPSSDQAVGQALRYMGWVQQHLAQDGEEVRGLIISHDAGDSIRYAVSAVPSIDLRLYEVEFRLNEPDAIDAEMQEGGDD
ncbi:MAG: DUF91 domain-containing protein [Nitrospiraceae bacterium]|nr:DUF91 domain-containing protein [Nitrospiraceae bacterium]